MTMTMISFTDLKGLENKAITAIRSYSPFGKLKTLKEAAFKTEIQLGNRSEINIHLGFKLPIRLREDKGARAIERAVHIGCLATCSKSADEISQLSYSVLIGRDMDPSKHVARKFHFDFEPASARNTHEPKPTFHLQICGKLSPQHQEEGFKEEHIDHLLPAWSQPRIPVQPTSLALILNWLFIEFGKESSVNAVRVDPNWRGVVLDAENRVLKPYFEDCWGFLNSASNHRESFVSKRLYEES